MFIHKYRKLSSIASNCNKIYNKPYEKYNLCHTYNMPREESNR
jgi:hypothetical protein